jgi:hypothetical protein
LHLLLFAYDKLKVGQRTGFGVGEKVGVGKGVGSGTNLWVGEGTDIGRKALGKNLKLETIVYRVDNDWLCIG